MTRFTEPAEDLSRRAKDYIDLRLDDIKLRTAKSLSMTASKLVAFFIIISVGTSLALALSFGLILLIGELIGSYAWSLIGELIGSYAWSAFGVSVLLAIGLWILIRRRDRLFKDTFVPLFVNLFFNNDDDEQEEQ